MNLRKYLAFAAGPIAAAIFTALTLPVMTWIVTPESIGAFALFQLTIALVFTVTSLGLEQALVRSYYEVESKKALFFETLIPALIWLALVVLVFLLTSKLGSLLVYLGLVGYELPLIVCLVFNLICTFCSCVLRMEGKALVFSTYLVVPKFLVFIIIFLGAFFGLNIGLTELVYSHTISLMLAGVIVLLSTGKIFNGESGYSLRPDSIKVHLRFGSPLVFSAVAFWGMTAFDRYALSIWGDLGQVALYSVAANFAAIGLLFQAIFSTMWSPAFYKWVSDGRDEGKIESALEIGVPFALLLYATVGVGSKLLVYIVPDSYSQVQNLVVVCLSFSILYCLSEITVVGLYAKRFTKLAMLAPIFGASVNVALCYVLIPIYGAAGAGVGVSIGCYVFFLLRTELSARYYGAFKRMKSYLSMAICVVIAACQAVYGKGNEFIFVILWAACFPIVFIVFRKTFSKAFRLLQVRADSA